MIFIWVSSHTLAAPPFPYPSRRRLRICQLAPLKEKLTEWPSCIYLVDQCTRLVSLNRWCVREVWPPVLGTQSPFAAVSNEIIFHSICSLNCQVDETLSVGVVVIGGWVGYLKVQPGLSRSLVNAGGRILLRSEQATRHANRSIKKRHFNTWSQ
jgi:hypothetical protein